MKSTFSLDNQNLWVHDFGKFKLILDKNDLDVSQQIKESGWYKDEELESKFLKKKLQKGMRLLDLGANIGFYSIFARSIIGEKGLVISFEPFPKNANLIRKSVKLNHYDNVVVVEAAVSDKQGKAKLYLSPEYYTENSLIDLEFTYPKNWKGQRAIDVKVVTIDDFLEKKIKNFCVNFIKMDIEGSEHKALIGMEKTIEQNESLALMTEFWPNGLIKNGSDPRDFLEHLASLNFNLLSHIDNEYERVYPVTVDQIMKTWEQRSKTILNEVMKTCDWYTNLLCVKKKKG